MRLCLPAVRLLGVVLVAVLFLAACGGHGDETATTPEAGLPTVPAGPSELPAVDPNAPLVEYHSPEKSYSVSYPQGWQVNTESGFADYFLWSADDGRPLAQLAVTCNAQALTLDDLISADAAVVARFGAGIDPSTIVPIQIAGTTGKQLMYTVPAGGLPVEQVVAYAPGEKCGWRLALASYGPGTLPAYLPLFQRIVASFQPG